MMKTPRYANSEVFKQLAELCESAGLPVRYVDVDDGLYARTREYEGIDMPNDERFESDEHAAMVLGHELGHQLLGTFFVDNEFNNSDTNEAMRIMIESQCDFAGVIFYKFAEMIALHKEESVWRDNTPPGGSA